MKQTYLRDEMLIHRVSHLLLTPLLSDHLLCCYQRRGPVAMRCLRILNPSVSPLPLSCQHHLLEDPSSFPPCPCCPSVLFPSHRQVPLTQLVLLLVLLYFYCFTMEMLTLQDMPPVCALSYFSIYSFILYSRT